jgi:hypothetical protein
MSQREKRLPHLLIYAAEWKKTNTVDCCAEKDKQLLVLLHKVKGFIAMTLGNTWKTKETIKSFFFVPILAE